MAVEHDERAVGQLREFGGVRPFRAAVEAVGVEAQVHFIGAGGAAAVDCFPKGAKTIVLRAPAFGAGAMPGTQRRRLVEKEQLGVPAWLHNHSMPVAKGGTARDPAPDLPGPNDRAVVVMQDAAITHDESARSDCDELAEGRNAVLERHVPLAHRWAKRERLGCSRADGRGAEGQGLQRSGNPGLREIRVVAGAGFA